MREIITNLGKIGITVEGEYNSTIEYKKLSIVNDPKTGKTYISKRDVPASAPLEDSDYWMPFVGGSTPVPPTPIVAQESNFNLENDVVKGYMNNVHYNDSEYEESFIYEYADAETDYKKDQPNCIEFKIEGNEFNYSETPTMNIINTINIIDNKVKIYNLIPNRVYYYNTDVDNTIKSFTTDGTRCFIKVDSVKNVRDLGGVLTLNGKQVKYGKIYRSNKLDDVTQDDLDTLESLGINTEIDLRNEDEVELVDDYIEFYNPGYMATSKKSIAELLEDGIVEISWLDETDTIISLKFVADRNFGAIGARIDINVKCNILFIVNVILKDKWCNILIPHNLNDCYLVCVFNKGNKLKCKRLKHRLTNTVSSIYKYENNTIIDKVNISFPNYKITNIDADTKNLIRTIVKYIFISIKSNNGIVYHCEWGCHRAGLLSTIIYGLLDVPQCEIDKDYELSAFAGYPNMERNNDENGYVTASKYIKENYGNWYNWCVEVLELDPKEIEEFRYNMIEDYGQSEIEYLTEDDIDELFGAPYDINSNAPSYVGEL